MLIRREIFGKLKFCCGEGIVETEKKKSFPRMQLMDGDNFRCNRNKRQKIMRNDHLFHQREYMRMHHFVDFGDEKHPAFHYAHRIMDKMEVGKSDWERVAFWKTYSVKILEEIRSIRNTKNHEMRNILVNGEIMGVCDVIYFLLNACY